MGLHILPDGMQRNSAGGLRWQVDGKDGSAAKKDSDAYIAVSPRKCSIIANGTVLDD